jgi:oligogalacturonide lyase
MTRIPRRGGFLCVLCVMALQAAGSSRPSEEPPREWIEPATGHRVVRLTAQAGFASLYFHQNPYTANADRMVVSSPQGL